MKKNYCHLRAARAENRVNTHRTKGVSCRGKSVAKSYGATQCSSDINIRIEETTH
jgi:hypothetical protein